MELRHLRYFCVLAETLHFGIAAGRLNIVQPALSMQIKKLEDELGVALFVRSKRKVELTQAGSLFLAEAQRCLTHAEQAKFMAREAERGAAGQLRLGISSGAVHSQDLRRVMQAFRRTSPNLLIEPVEVHPAQAPEAVLRGDIDAALGTITVGVMPRGLAMKKMSSHAAILVLPDDHALAELPEIPVDALRGETFVGYSAPDDLPGMSLTADALGYLPVSYRTVSSPSMTVGLVAAGLGVAIIPESMARTETGAVFRKLKDRDFVVDVALIWAVESNPGALAAIDRLLRQ